MKTLAVSLTAVTILLLASSTASAGWTYYGTVQIGAPAPVVTTYPVYPVYPPPAYTYVYPGYAYPTYPPTVVIGTRVHVPPRVWRRPVWTVW